MAPARVRLALGGLAAILVAATATGTSAHATSAAGAAEPATVEAAPLTAVLDAVEVAPPPTTTAPPVAPPPTTTAPPTPAPEVAPAAPIVPIDPYAPRCAGCPAVQPDPDRPVLARRGATAAPVLSAVRTTDPVVFLTIDDGEFWNEDAAALLAAARVPFTLFLTERYIADKIPEMQRLTTVGGWVELHTATHPDLFRRGNDAREICGPLDAYELAFARRSTLFRPPYGNTNGTTQRVAATCGLEAVVLWRASMNYGALATQGGPLRAGDIVLMHFRPDLADNLRELFRVVEAQGLRLGRLECYVGGDPRCGRPWR